MTMGQRHPHRRQQWNVICDVCGWKYKNWQLKKRWDGLMVCAADWEPRQVLDLIKVPKDDQSVPWARPEVADRFIEPDYPDDLTPIPDGTFDTGL